MLKAGALRPGSAFLDLFPRNAAPTQRSGILRRAGEPEQEPSGGEVGRLGSCQRPRLTDRPVLRAGRVRHSVLGPFMRCSYAPPPATSPSASTSSTASPPAQLGTVLYEGPVPPTKGTWLGIEWDEPSRGRHSGVYDKTGVRYFSPRSVPALSALPSGSADGAFARAGSMDRARSFAQTQKGSTGAARRSTRRSGPSTSTTATTTATTACSAPRLARRATKQPRRPGATRPTATSTSRSSCRARSPSASTSLAGCARSGSSGRASAVRRGLRTMQRVGRRRPMRCRNSAGV